ncbi:sugar ABC transporter permease [Alicyclobacillus cellulosilyticus]|uniref:Sugar ABC transporter permease n=1 Tax=Alicyclobacillus cellulosilyticus TaxID=1003997 RepID=A0A917K7M1_9BACL|nr:sugar ABC transporter permease [Alicyclobacillus cellulosilyticus]GGJ04055.1 sugar ABC transporter permease [Alicyclobacillus cellulosilyticus]
MVTAKPRPKLRYETKYLYIFILPWIIGFIAFTAGPIVMSGVYSFTRYNLVLPPAFVGLQNYAQLLRDPLFWQSLKVTGIYTFVSVPLGLVLSLLVAVLVNMRIPGQRAFRTAVYFPTLVSGVVMSLLWLWLLNPQFGIINYLLWELFGIKGPQWLYSPQWALPSLILMTIWGIGTNMVLYLAALQGVPRSLYEAAELDGAGRIRRFFTITVPMISPTTLFLLITGIIGTSQVFTQAAVMTQGGPEYATYFYVYYLYQEAFGSFNIGYASAMSWVLLLVVFLLTYILMRTSERWVNY